LLLLTVQAGRGATCVAVLVHTPRTHTYTHIHTYTHTHTYTHIHMFTHH